MEVPQLTQKMPTSIQSEKAKAAGLKIYPNPAENEIHIVYTSAEQGRTAMRVTDLSGKMLLSGSYDVAEGENILRVKLDNLASGVYVLECTTDGYVSRQRFVVVK